MSKMIQIRNVPERMHRELRRRARARGLTLTDYIQQILERELSRPPAEEVFERIARSSPVDLGTSAAELIHEERSTRGRLGGAGH
jgi:plasmid stability protein